MLTYSPLFCFFFFQAMAKARQDHNSANAVPAVIPEYRLWEEHWIRFVFFAI